MDGVKLLEHAVWGALFSKNLIDRPMRMENLQRVLDTHSKYVNVYAGGASKTLLQTAVTNADVSVVQELIYHDADVNIAYDSHKGSIDCLSEIFYLSEEPGRLRIAYALLDAGADVNTKRTIPGISLLDESRKSNDHDFTNLLHEFGVDDDYEAYDD
jgi:hypothetical protein